MEYNKHVIFLLACLPTYIIYIYSSSHTQFSASESNEIVFRWHHCTYTPILHRILPLCSLQFLSNYSQLLKWCLIKHFCSLQRVYIYSFAFVCSVLYSFHHSKRTNNGWFFFAVVFAQSQNHSFSCLNTQINEMQRFHRNSL